MKHCLLFFLVLFALACTPKSNEVDINRIPPGSQTDFREQQLQKSKQSQIADHVFQMQKAKRLLGFILNPPVENVRLQCLDIKSVSEYEWDINYDCLFESQDFDSDAELLVRLRGSERIDLTSQRIESSKLDLITFPKRFPNRTLAQYEVERSWRILKIEEGPSTSVYDIENRWALTPSIGNRKQHLDSSEIYQRLKFLVRNEDRKVLSLEAPIRSQLRFDWKTTRGKKIQYLSGTHTLSSDAPALFKGTCSWPVGDWEFDINVDQEQQKRKGALRIAEQSMLDRKTGRRWAASQSCFSPNAMDWVDF